MEQTVLFDDRVEDTLQTAKEFLKNEMKNGTSCPCCGQFVKLYRRSISSAMAWGLIQMAKQPEGEWVDTTALFSRFGKNCPSGVVDFTKLRHWKFVEGLDGEREDGSKRVGKWRVTREGRWFAENRQVAQKYCLVFNNTVYGFEGEFLKIKDCLGNKFNYNELIGC